MAHVDVSFRLVGRSLPIDHGYALYAAISRVLGPVAHGANGLAIHPVRGVRVGKGLMQLDGRSRLRIRTPIDGLPVLLRLAGRALDVDGHALRVGIPQIYPLVPAANLGARCVMIKGFTEPESFLVAVRQKLTGSRAEAPACELGLSMAVEAAIPLRRAGSHAGQPIRRVLTIKNKRIVGFGLIVRGLTAEESLLLQEKGIGGRRHMGCGVFVPLRPAHDRGPDA